MWLFGNDSSNLPEPVQATAHGITFTHKTTRRALRLSIKVGVGGVTVVSPPSVSLEAVTAFVQANRNWIIAAQKKQYEQAPDAYTVTIFGKEYGKQLAYQKSARLGVRIENGTVIINTPELLLDPQKVWNASHTKLLNTFLDNAARTYISQRLVQLAAKMQVAYNQVSFKKQSTRWGSCSSQKNLNFNLRLVHAPTPVIDYVIIHELAHLTHMDHSARFWHRVAQFDPDHQVHRGWLKRHGGSMEVG